MSNPTAAFRGISEPIGTPPEHVAAYISDRNRGMAAYVKRRARGAQRDMDRASLLLLRDSLSRPLARTGGVDTADADELLEALDRGWKR